MAIRDLTKGPIFKTLFFYSLPIIFTNLVQLLFHAADTAILALMASGEAVAAVGACGSIITLLVSLFTGLATGANVLVARRTGAKDAAGVKRATGTAMLLSVTSGVFLAVFALLFARRILILTNCQPAVLDRAVTYMVIYFAGMPITMIYNFAAAVLRATGDSMRPMIYINAAGILNVGLNAAFVGWLGLSVTGVALATVLSNAVAVVLILCRLFRRECPCRIEFKNLRFRREELSRIAAVGVPTCLCSIFFFMANVVLQSKVNTLGTQAMTANALSGQFDGAIYTVGCAIAIATAAMMGQNRGAMRFDRIRKTLRVSLLYAITVSLALGTLFVLIAEPLLGIMTDSRAVIDLAKSRMTLLCLTYFMTTGMEVFSFSLRSIGHQISTMVVGAICGFGLRVSWATFVWPLHPTLPMLYACYAISAGCAIVIYLVVFFKGIRKMERDCAGATP